MRKTASISAAFCLMAVIIAVPSAQAAVTASSVTTPKDLTYLMYNKDAPNTYAISGTSNGTTGDLVDLICYAGDKTVYAAQNVPLNADGSFSVPAAAVQAANTYRVCKLHAVPSGTTPPNPSAYPGPRLLVGYKDDKPIGAGPNTGTLQDYYLYFQQLSGGNDYDSLGGCGIDDGYLLDSNDSQTTVTWYCNAALFNSEAIGGTRSEVQVDGSNAYPPAGANAINSKATSGFPALTYSYKVNPHTGDATIHETDPLVKCPSATYPPSLGSCPTFASAGVKDTRTILQTQKGLVTWVTDVFTSTDGHAHTLNLLWDNEQRFHSNSYVDSTQLEYKFPGDSAYLMHALNGVVNLPASSPGTILIRMHGAPDGNTSPGQGAIVYDRPATSATFTYVDPVYERFTLNQTAKVPAHGSVRFRFAYVDGLHAAAVASLAKQAVTVFKGCTVPNVVGKTLAAAKKALVHAHCAVGKLKRTASSTIATGIVVAENPAAGTHVDYGTKVVLLVSKG